MEAWTIEKCFVKCGFSEDVFETIIVDDDDDDGFSELQSLINGVVSDYAVADYLEQDENAPPAVDTTSSAWKEDLCNKVVRLFTGNDNDNNVEMDDSDSDESFDEERPEPKIKSCRVALDTIDDLSSFADANTDDIELKRALAQVTECLEKLRLQPVSQKKITSFFCPE